MTFKEKLELNHQAYMAAKKSYKDLNIEVATRNNTQNIAVVKYDTASPNKSTERDAYCAPSHAKR